MLVASIAHPHLAFSTFVNEGTFLKECNGNSCNITAWIPRRKNTCHVMGQGRSTLPSFFLPTDRDTGVSTVSASRCLFFTVLSTVYWQSFPPLPAAYHYPLLFFRVSTSLNSHLFFFSLFLPIPTKPRLGSVGGHVDRQLLLGKSCPLLHLFDGPGLVSRPSQIECRLVLSRV